MSIKIHDQDLIMILKFNQLKFLITQFHILIIKAQPQLIKTTCHIVIETKKIKIKQHYGNTHNHL